MKLRTQFFILVGGIIAVPFLVSAFMLLIQYNEMRRRQPLPNYEQIMSWVGHQVPRAIRRNDLSALMEDRPDGLDVVILNKAFNVAYSTIPQVERGMSAASGTLWSYISANIDQYHFQVDNSRAPGAEDFLVILKLPKIQAAEMRSRVATVQVVMYSSIALLAFSSLMSFFILRSLNGSIQSLEGATRRIAEGNLDFELPARGNDQISSLTRSFDSMRRALKEEYARRARFIMGVSHDLRTPLTLIQGYVEAVADGYAAGPAEQKKYLSIVIDKARALEGMVGDLIEFVRMDTGQWRMTHRDVPIAVFLGEIARRFEEDAIILKRSFDWAIEIPDATTVRMDAGLFTRALENLVGNAIRYTEDNGGVTMDARRESGEIRLVIADTGIGIPPEDLPRIFDPFYRGTNSRREQGFGLGLTTVKSIIEGHGWSIAVASVVGRGTTFTIRMPVGGIGAEAGTA